MKKLALLAFTVASAAFFSLAAAPQESSAGDPCVRKEFKTQMVRDACAKGGQAEAKKTMKKFFGTMRAKAPEVTHCTSCHTSLSPDYKLTSNALELFMKAGGK